MPTSVIIPVLVYPDVRQAVEWLCRSFGFVERLRIGNHRAQLSFGEGDLVVAAKRPDSDASPADLLGHSVMVRVD
ncbi:MAG TPA: glyoxalase, partial [Blastocatellia bacterium]|nr:glyoxalase [Blastocatellia bacterium]